MSYSAHRPKGSKGQTDSRLSRVIRQLRQTLAEAQRRFSHDTLRLDAHGLDEMAAILVDFAEDLHSGTGIWEAYEHYNTDLFGTALPLTSKEGSGSGMELRADRFRQQRDAASR
jgi:hypothetical protein